MKYNREDIENAYRIALEPFAYAESAAMRKHSNINGKWINQEKAKNTGKEGGRPRKLVLREVPKPEPMILFKSVRSNNDGK